VSERKTALEMSVLSFRESSIPLIHIEMILIMSQEEVRFDSDFVKSLKIMESCYSVLRICKIMP